MSNCAILSRRPPQPPHSARLQSNAPLKPPHVLEALACNKGHSRALQEAVGRVGREQKKRNKLEHQQGNKHTNIKKREGLVHKNGQTPETTALQCDSGTWANGASPTLGETQRHSTTVRNVNKNIISLTLKTPALQRTGCAAARETARPHNRATQVHQNHRHHTSTPQQAAERRGEMHDIPARHHPLQSCRMTEGDCACNRFRHYFLV